MFLKAEEVVGMDATKTKNRNVTVEAVARLKCDLGGCLGNRAVAYPTGASSLSHPVSIS